MTGQHDDLDGARKWGAAILMKSLLDPLLSRLWH